MTSLVGQTVSHYKILQQLGAGGMGVVYKAEDTRLHRTVALKFLNPEMLFDEHEKIRFEHEAEAAAQVCHPNIATVYDFEEHVEPGTATRRAFIAMEFVDGESLMQRIARAPLAFEEVASIARQIAGALQTAHQQGIVHRDVKPANIIVRSDGSVKMLDFGIAKSADQTRMTVAGNIVGSVAYMSPEQLQGLDVDERSDIWSFGVVLYEMLTQRSPFEGAHAPAVVYAISNLDPQTPETFRDDVPPQLSALCMACLRKNRSERPESMGLVLSMLEGLTRPVAWEKRSKLHVSSWWRSMALILGAAALAGAFLFMLPPLKAWIERLWVSAPSGRRILVVVPFTPLDSSMDCQRFCTSLSWMVPSRLAHLTSGDTSIALVSSRDASEYHVTNSEGARKMLGASLVVTGTMQRLGDNFRLTVDLVDAASQRQLDSRFITHAAGNYTAMEDDAVHQVITMLPTRALLSPIHADEKGTADDQAYQYFAQGQGYMQQYQKRESLKIAAGLFVKALAIDSLFAKAHAGLGETYWRLFEVTNDTLWIPMAEQEAAKAVRLKPNLVEGYVTTGVIKSGTGRYELAVKDFENALVLDPNNTDAMRGLARSYMNLGAYEKAESVCRAAIAGNPSYWAGYSYLGYFYYSRGQYEKAAAEYRKVIELTPDNVRGYNNLGAMLIHQQRWGQAIDTLERSVKLEPLADTYSLLAAAYFYQKDYRDASRAYKEALRIDSSDYQVWGSLASLQYWTSGERVLSRSTFRHAIALAETKRKVNPRDPVLLSHMANFHAFLGDKQKALSLVRASLKESDNSPELLERAADTYLAIGETSRALECLEDALKAGFEPGLLLLNPDPAMQALISNERIRSLMRGADTDTNRAQ